MNVEDTRFGMAEYVLHKHGLDTIEVKRGRGVKCIGGDPRRGAGAPAGAGESGSPPAGLQRHSGASPILREVGVLSGSACVSQLTTRGMCPAAFHPTPH
jgi:hypothetical protein